MWPNKATGCKPYRFFLCVNFLAKKLNGCSCSYSQSQPTAPLHSWDGSPQPQPPSPPLWPGFGSGRRGLEAKRPQCLQVDWECPQAWIHIGCPSAGQWPCIWAGPQISTYVSRIGRSQRSHRYGSSSPPSFACAQTPYVNTVSQSIRAN